jgi:hypothetical protein
MLVGQGQSAPPHLVPLAWHTQVAEGGVRLHALVQDVVPCGRYLDATSSGTSPACQSFAMNTTSSPYVPPEHGPYHIARSVTGQDWMPFE